MAILRAGAFCPVGLDVEQTASSILAGLPRKQETLFNSKTGEPIVLGHLPGDVLPPLASALEQLRAPPSRLVTRLLRLATPALQEILLAGLPHGIGALPPLLVACPQPPPGEPALVPGAFLGQLAHQAEVRVALEASQIFPLGHAGLFTAVQHAYAKVLAPRLAEFVVVGGVDSYFDAKRLTRLELEHRLLTEGLQDAFTPGEGAAFVLLASRGACLRYGLEPLAWIAAVGTAMEAGHRHAEAPHRGDGLAAALHTLLRDLGDRAEPIRLVMAGLNGESFNAKEWGIACVRHRECLADPLRIEHPAEYTGDMGAALAPVMLAVTALELKASNLQGPALVWAASDQAERGALYMTAA